MLICYPYKYITSYKSDNPTLENIIANTLHDVYIAYTMKKINIHIIK